MPWGWLTLRSVAVKIVGVPWEGLGDTFVGDKSSDGAGFEGANVQGPALGASLKMVSLAVAYRQPSGPMVPEPSDPFARTVVVNGLVVILTSLRALLLCTSRDLAAPLACTSPIVIQKSELIPDSVVIAGGEGVLVPATWIMFPAAL